MSLGKEYTLVGKPELDCLESIEYSYIDGRRHQQNNKATTKPRYSR
ncbi:hypothetical protein SDC9_207933 [bioreactor metagenome]|uniref:Uncharacterized protein n=1 Tax=bioreactor metagenome TaxID=1076179 RepID=A0A645J969_9ZZZZ